MKRLFSVFCIICLLISSFTMVPQAQTAVTWGNPDGTVAIDAADALLVLQYSVGKAELTALQISACDVDCSNGVDAADALQILQVSVDKLQAFQPTGLRGAEVTIGSVYAAKYTADTAYGKAWQQAVAAVEGAFGVDIVVEQINLSEDKNSLWLYDLVELPISNARSLAKEGLLKNLANNAALDWTALDSGATGSCVMGDTVCGAASPAMTAAPMGIAMNGDLLARYAPESYGKLAQQFEDGTWTFEALAGLAAEYRANNPGAPVMMSNTNIIGQAIVANAGYEVKFLEDGTGAVCSIASQEGITALQYVKGLLNEGSWTYQADVRKMFEQFRAGQVPMVVYYLGESASAAGDFTLTAMPFPKGPAQEDYVMCTFGSSTFAIPELADHYGNAAAMVLNGLCYADETIAQGVVASAAQAGFDKLGQAVYQWAVGNTSPDFSTGPFTAAVGGPVDGSVLDPTKDPATEMPRIARLIQREVDAYYGQFYKE